MNDTTGLQAFRAAEADPDPLALARGRRRLLEHIDPGAGRTAGHRPRSRWTAIARGGVVVGLGAAAVLGGVLVGPNLDVGMGGASAEAAEALDRAAAAAMTQPPAPAPGPGRVAYTHTIKRSGVPKSEGGTGEACLWMHEQWQDTNGEIRIRWVQGATLESALDPAAPVVDEPACDDPVEEFTDQFRITDDELELEPDPSALTDEERAAQDELLARLGAWLTPDAAFVAGLPTDPAALYERARADAQGVDLLHAETLNLLTDLALSNSPHLTPELKAAVLRAVARVPGVELAGEGETLFGDRGVVVRRVEPDQESRHELLFDPATGEVLGQRSLAAAQDDPSGAAGSALVETGSRTAVVDALGERP